MIQNEYMDGKCGKMGMIKIKMDNMVIQWMDLHQKCGGKLRDLHWKSKAK